MKYSKLLPNIQALTKYSALIKYSTHLPNTYGSYQILS